MTLGRSRTCTVALRDPAASRSHAQLVLAAGTVRARDLQSSNGTYLNGERLEAERLLGPGDRLTIGETDLVVRVEGPQSPDATVRVEIGNVPEPPEPRVEEPGAAASPTPQGPAASSPSPGQVAGASAAPPFSAPPPTTSPPAGGGWSEGAMGTSPVAPASLAASAPTGPSPPPPDAGPETSPRTATAPSPVGTVAATPGPVTPPAAVAAPPAPAASPPRFAAAVGTPTAPAAVLAPDLPPAAGFWIRAVAVMLDGAWMIVFALLASLPFGGPLRPGGGVAMGGVLLLLAVAVPVLGWWLWGATPGKAVFGLSVRSLDGAVPITLGRSLARWLATWASAAFFGLGFLMVLFTANRRALHDLAAATYVARRR